MATPEKTKKSIEKFMPFPWDRKEDRGAPLTEQELQNALKLFS